MKTAIRNIEYNELKKWADSNNLPKYRVEQIYKAIFCEYRESFDSISNIPKDLKLKLNDEFNFFSLALVETKTSEDGSMKFLFVTEDEKYIESVYMPADSGRQTLCISTMYACPVACEFCATGKLSNSRKLNKAEILDQIYIVQTLLKEKLTNIVLMGMGEPLLNYENTTAALEVLTSDFNQLFSRKKITLSTVGVPMKIRQLANTKKPVKLAISLHATTDKQRNQIIPINKNYPISELMEDVEFYYKKTHIPITYEYILFDGFNDSLNDVKRLAKIARRVSSKVNIIPFNDISFQDKNIKLNPADEKKINNFADELKSLGVYVSTRKSYGKDIIGACGQLSAFKEM